MSSIKYILGIDEVGRGSLAGPVYLTGVLLENRFPKHTYNHSKKPFPKKYSNLKFIRDSKLLKEKDRFKCFELFNLLQQKKLTLYCSSQLIDRYGIGTCLSYMMHLIIINLNQINTKIIVDGKIKILNKFDNDLVNKILNENNIDINNQLNNFYFSEKPSTQKPLLQTEIIINREPKADDKYLSIAIASNIAKVSRDNIMKDLHNKFPQYHWNENKGYGTKKHRAAIKLNPNNKHLRKTFLSNIINPN